MNETHEPFCDRSHSPRQRCNRALGMDDASSAREIAQTPPDVEPLARPSLGDVLAPPGGAPAEAPGGDVTRETIATIEMTLPTEFVLREWNKTASVVERVYRPARASEPAERRGGPGPAIALAGAAISFVLLVVFVARRRRPSSQ